MMISREEERPVSDCRASNDEWREVRNNTFDNFFLFRKYICMDSCGFFFFFLQVLMGGKFFWDTRLLFEECRAFLKLTDGVQDSLGCQGNFDFWNFGE